jgi:hypothetical protein
MLRWCVEMILESVEVAGLNSWLEQVDGRSSEEILQWRLRTLQNNLHLLTFLVELDLLSGINFGVLELEVVIFELLGDWHGGFEVNWGLIRTIANSTLAVFGKQIRICRHPVVLSEFSWPPVNGIQIVFAVVIIKIVLMIFGATWHAADNRQTRIDEYLLHLREVRLVEAHSLLLWSSGEGELVRHRTGVHVIVTFPQSVLSFVVSESSWRFWNNDSFLLFDSHAGAAKSSRDGSLS